MKPWVKLYRREEGSFAQLPLLTRGLAAEILKLADETGRIGLGRRAPADAVCFALGAERNERRAVRRHVDLLLADGYLVHDEDARELVIPGFPRFQGTDDHRAPAASATRPQRVATEPPKNLQRAPTDPPTRAHGDSNVRPHEAKSSESINSAPRADLEKRREEERREEVERAGAPHTAAESAPERGDPAKWPGCSPTMGGGSPPPRFDPLGYDSGHPVVAAVVRGWCDTWAELDGGRRPTLRGHTDQRGAAELAYWLEQHCHANGADPLELGGAIAGHYLRARWEGGRRPALAWLNPDAAQYAFNPADWLSGPPKRGPRPVRARGGRGPKPPSASHPPPRDLPDLPDDVWEDPTPAELAI